MFSRAGRLAASPRSNYCVSLDRTTLLSAQVGYQINKTWSVTADIFNLLNNTDHDIDYYYDSRVRPGDDVVGQIHFHPVEPIQVRFAVTARF